MAHDENINLLTAVPGDYVVIGVSWSDQRVGKSLHERDIMYGVCVRKLADGSVMLTESGVAFKLSDKQLAAVTVERR